MRLPRGCSAYCVTFAFRGLISAFSADAITVQCLYATIARLALSRHIRTVCVRSLEPFIFVLGSYWPAADVVGGDGYLSYPRTQTPHLGTYVASVVYHQSRPYSVEFIATMVVHRYHYNKNMHYSSSAKFTECRIHGQPRRYEFSIRSLK